MSGEFIGNGNMWFKDADNFYNGWACVQREDKKWNFINTDGKIIGNGKVWFDRFSYFLDGWAFVILNGKRSYIDTKENLYDEDGNLIGNLNDSETLRKAGLEENRTRHIRLTEGELRQVIRKIIRETL